ncbi:MAG: CBS domain-containing protein [Pseudomonadota bacterium]
MQIKDKPTFKTKPKPITFLAEESVQQALDVMCEKNIGSIIVINKDETIAGIVTERDMMIRVLGAKINPETTPLSQIMSKNVKVANETDDLVDWMQTMSHERFRHLPIVDAEGKLVNMMSQGDFVAYTWPDLYEKVKQDLKGRLGRSMQTLLIIFAVVTLGLIAFNL